MFFFGVAVIAGGAMVGGGDWYDNMSEAVEFKYEADDII